MCRLSVNRDLCFDAVFLFLQIAPSGACGARVNIHEYQAKEIFRKNGIPIPPGEVATTAEEAEAIARKFGGTVVVKAQVHAGGRGKAGGVKLAKTPEAAKAVARDILKLRIKRSEERRVGKE